jgi:hypothetical protein
MLHCIKRSWLQMAFHRRTFLQQQQCDHRKLCAAPAGEEIGAEFDDCPIV